MKTDVRPPICFLMSKNNGEGVWNRTCERSICCTGTVVVSFPFIIGPSFPSVLQVSWNFFFNFGKLAMMVIGEVSTVAV